MALYRNGIREDVISGAPGTINGKPNKATPVDADVMLIEDSAAGFAQKNALLSSFPEKHTQGTDQALDTGGGNEVTAANAKDAVDKKHTQGTDQYLDQGGGNQVSVADAKDAVDKKHTQGTDLGLDTGGSNPITAATAKGHVDDVSGNPHGVTLEQARTAGNTVSGDIALGGNEVTGAPSTPSVGSAYASKDYVDGLVQGLHWQDAVEGYQTTPPGTPGTGDRYIVEPTGTGAWSGQDNDIATWNGSSWDFDTPTEGYATRILDDDNQRLFNGTVWVFFGATITHNNTAGLQGGTATERNHLSNAQVSALHTQGTDQALDTGGANEVSAANAKAGYTHSTGDGTDHSAISSGHPHQDVTSGQSPTFNGVNISGIVTGDVDQVHLAARKGSGGTIPIFTPVYITGYNAGGWLEVEPADALLSAGKLPAVAITESAITAGVDGFVAMSGRQTGLDTSTPESGTWAVGDELYVASGGGFTKTRPLSPLVGVQKMAEVVRIHSSQGVIVIYGAGRLNDVPNRTLGFAPEFGNAVISRPGSNEGVQFSSDHDASNNHNLFRGESANATLQASSLIQRILLPEVWPGWAAEAIKYFNRVDATPGNTGLTVKVYDTGGTLRHTDAKQANTSWTETVIADSDLSAGTWTPGAWIKIEYLFEAQNGKGAELAEVKLSPAGD